MRISFVLNNFSHQKRKNTFVNKSYKADSISFSSKSTVKSRILNLPEEAFLSNEFRQYILSNLNDKNILDLHLAYYQDLLACKTLDEAKEKYPEFQNVFSANEINPQENGVERYYKKVEKGQIEGVSIDNLTLQLLKVLFAKLNSPFEIGQNKILGMGRKSVDRLILALNIPYDKRYFDIISIQKNANLTSISWQNEDRKENAAQKIKASWQDDKKRELASKRSQERWQNPEFREDTSRKIKDSLDSPEIKQRQSDRMKAVWLDEVQKERRANAIRKTLNSPEVKERIIEERKQRSKNPEYLEKLSKASRTNWQDEEFVELMSVVSKAGSLAWQIHPSAKNIFKEIAKKYPGLGEIKGKKKKGIPLTPAEKSLGKRYFSECHKKHPEILDEIGAIQKEILRQWGFYNKDRNINEILNNIMSQDWDSIEDIL